MVIPPQSLSPEALLAILEDFITRDGTDYGDRELTLDQKVLTLRPQVMRGQVLIVFDPATEQVNLISKEEWREPE